MLRTIRTSDSRISGEGSLNLGSSISLFAQECYSARKDELSTVLKRRRRFSLLLTARRQNQPGEPKKPRLILFSSPISPERPT